MSAAPAAAAGGRARRAMPDIVGPGRAVVGAARRLAEVGRSALLALVVAVLAPANSVGRIMAPASDWKTILFNPIGDLHPAGRSGSTSSSARPACSTSATSPSSRSAPTPWPCIGTEQHWNFWLVLPVGIILAAVAGVILGARPCGCAATTWPS